MVKLSVKPDIHQIVKDALSGRLSGTISDKKLRIEAYSDVVHITLKDTSKRELLAAFNRYCSILQDLNVNIVLRARPVVNDRITTGGSDFQTAQWEDFETVAAFKGYELPPFMQQLYLIGSGTFIIRRA